MFELARVLPETLSSLGCYELSPADVPPASLAVSLQSPFQILCFLLNLPTLKDPGLNPGFFSSSTLCLGDATNLLIKIPSTYGGFQTCNSCPDFSLQVQTHTINSLFDIST